MRTESLRGRQPIEYYDGTALIHRRLNQLAVTTPFTTDLQTTANEILLPFLEKKGVTPRDPHPVPTYFIPRKNRREIRHYIDLNPKTADAAYYLSFDAVVLFLSGEALRDTENYYHEQLHGLGRCILSNKSDGRSLTIVGYELVIQDENDDTAFSRGEFLEETIVERLAIALTQEHFRRKGINYTRQEISKTASMKPYRQMDRQLEKIIRTGGPELESLIIRARFDSTLIRQLIDGLNGALGPQAAQEIFHLPQDPDVVRAVLKKYFTPSDTR